MGVYFSRPGGVSELLIYRRVGASVDVDEVAKIKTDSRSAPEERAEFVDRYLKLLEQKFWEMHKFESAPDVSEVVTKSSWLGLRQERQVKELDDPKESNAAATTFWMGDRTDTGEHNRTLVLLNKPYFGVKHMNDLASRKAHMDPTDPEFALPTEMAIVSYDAKIDFVKRSRKMVVNRKPAVNFFWVTMEERAQHSEFIDSVEKLSQQVLKEVQSQPRITRPTPVPSAPPVQDDGDEEEFASARPDSRDSQASSGSFVQRFIGGLLGGGGSSGPEAKVEEKEEEEKKKKKNPSRFAPADAYSGKADMVRKDLYFKDPRQRQVLNLIFERAGAVLKEQQPQPDLWKTAFPRSYSKGRLVPEKLSSRNLLYYADLDVISPNSLVAVELLLRGGNVNSSTAREFAGLTRSRISEVVASAVRSAGGKTALVDKIMQKARAMQSA